MQPQSIPSSQKICLCGQGDLRLHFSAISQHVPSRPNYALANRSAKLTLTNHLALQGPRRSRRVESQGRCCSGTFCESRSYVGANAKNQRSAGTRSEIQRQPRFREIYFEGWTSVQAVEVALRPMVTDFHLPTMSASTMAKPTRPPFAMPSVTTRLAVRKLSVNLAGWLQEKIQLTGRRVPFDCRKPPLEGCSGCCHIGTLRC